MTPAASKLVTKTRLAFLPDRPIAPVLSTVSSLGIRGDVAARDQPQRPPVYD
jgi:hypothetical protein